MRLAKIIPFIAAVLYLAVGSASADDYNARVQKIVKNGKTSVWVLQVIFAKPGGQFGYYMAPHKSEISCQQELMARALEISKMKEILDGDIRCVERKFNMRPRS